MKTLLLALSSIIAFAFAVQAQQNPPSVFEKRANDIVRIINDPKDFETTFSPAFLASVPPEQIKTISAQLLANFGKAVRVLNFDAKDGYNGEISILFERNVVAKMNLTVENASPYLVSHLIITATEKTSSTFDDIIAELKTLPGQTALTVAKLDGNNIQPMISYNNQKSLAIGSSFKLYVLSELARSITADERKWSDVVELNEFSLPSGMIQDWEKGSPVTFHTLASLMISISDNTATDQLITALGRDKIEKMMTAAGNSNPNLSLPFLKTVEMFKLKGSGDKNLAQSYSVKDAAGKRAMLNNEVAAFKKEDIDFQNFLKKPTFISQIEWFASTDDLARVMNWLRANSETSAANKVRGILTINKALPAEDAQNWNYVGYKGGSETGVISMTYLLQSKKGEWFVVSSTWNNEDAALNEGGFVALIQKTVKILQGKTQ